MGQNMVETYFGVVICAFSVLKTRDLSHFLGRLDVIIDFELFC